MKFKPFDMTINYTSGRQRRAPWGLRLLPAENTVHHGALIAASGYALYLFLLHDGAHGTAPLTLCTFHPPGTSGQKSDKKPDSATKGKRRKPGSASSKDEPRAPDSDDIEEKSEEPSNDDTKDKTTEPENAGTENKIIEAANPMMDPRNPRRRTPPPPQPEESPSPPPDAPAEEEPRNCYERLIDDLCFTSPALSPPVSPPPALSPPAPPSPEPQQPPPHPSPPPQLYHHRTKSRFKKMKLFPITVQRRNFKIVNVIESEVETTINQFVAYSLALDESTDRNDKGHLAIFIRGVNEHFTVSEYLLDIITKYKWRRSFPGTERHHRTEEVEFAMACVNSNRRGSSFIV
ncbi:hypothetical protein ANN_24838 [Periplaneta americana]|uniref:Uncharacterized protein n=1 Tax=Periplaneta americana TaxID=6978 RepID=A0ABQ8S0C9_PERAM|nr:hypothetical protein ANN_24838 [Periplaneta americana]